MNRAQRRNEARQTKRHGTGHEAPLPASLFTAAAQAALAGDLAGAVRLYEQGLSLDPAHVTGRHDLGVMLLRGGHYREAVDHLDRVVRQQPLFAPAWVNLSLAHGERRDTKSALAAARRAVALKPDLSAAHAALGHALGLR